MAYTAEAMEGFTFGCDPEFFIVDAEGHPVPASNFLSGTKKEPIPVKYGAYQVDGLAAEINIDPANNFADFNRNIDAVLGQVKALIPKGYSLSKLPSITFDQAVFESAPPECHALGCDPDYDAWTGERNVIPNTDATPYLRTAAGHIHVGWEQEPVDLSDQQHIMNCQQLVRQMDWYLGCWSLQKDPDPTRRLLYGKAGACRYKTYGVEYRVLSNFWIWSIASRRDVWNRANYAVNQMATGYMPLLSRQHNTLLIDCINTSQRSPALERRYQYPLLRLPHQ